MPKKPPPTDADQVDREKREHSGKNTFAQLRKDQQDDFDREQPDATPNS